MQPGSYGAGNEKTAYCNISLAAESVLIFGGLRSEGFTYLFNDFNNTHNSFFFFNFRKRSNDLQVNLYWFSL